MENFKCGSLLEVDFFEKNVLLDFSYEASGDKFYNFSEYGILLLSVNKTCLEFDTHFINTTKLLWNSSSSIKETINGFNNFIINEQKDFYLFVRAKNKKGIYYVGKSRTGDISETGKRILDKPYILKGSIITLEKAINESLWDQMGWNRCDLSIRGLKLPNLYVQEYYKGIAFSTDKRVGKRINYPYIYMMSEINNYLDHLFKLGKEILNQNLISGKFICIGEITSEEYIVLNYAKSNTEPTVEKFYSTFIIANSIEEYINHNYDNIENEVDHSI